MNRLPRIMVVDDEEVVTATTAEYLQSEGFETRGYTKPAEALKAIREFNPDLILLDIMMPEIDGYEFCKHVNADPERAEIPVIFVTGKDRQDDAMQFLKSGGKLLICKPIRLSELKTLVTLATQKQIEF